MFGAELVGEDGGADGTVDADEASGPTDAGAVAGDVAGDVCAAGCSIRTGELLMELTTKAVAPPAPTMPPRIRASTSGFIRRCRRGGRPMPEGAGGGVGGGYPAIEGVSGALPAGATGGQLAGVDGCAPGPSAAVVRVAPRPVRGDAPTAAPAAALTAAGAAAATGPDQANPDRDSVPLAYVRVSDSGSQSPSGCSAPTSASRPLAVGRCLGSLARQCSISGRIVAGTRSRSGVPCTTRYSRAAVVPVPNGPSPVAANASTAPRLKMSLGGPTSYPVACSGDMNPGEPTTRPAWVSMVDSAAREMPKSMTRGPSSASSTFDGLRSRCTTPAA